MFNSKIYYYYRILNVKYLCINHTSYFLIICIIKTRGHFELRRLSVWAINNIIWFTSSTHTPQHIPFKKIPQCLLINKNENQKWVTFKISIINLLRNTCQSHLLSAWNYLPWKFFRRESRLVNKSQDWW